MARKTQSNVTLNAKLSSVNLQRIALKDDSSFSEGAPVKIDATTGGAAIPLGCSPAAEAANAVVFMNWVDSDRSDVAFIQQDKTDSTAPTMYIEGGGLTGILGNDVDVGLPASLWNHSGQLPTINYGVFISAAGTKWQAEAIVAGRTYYGRIYRHYNGRAHFIFHSVPHVYA
jgi:hypothetical protein